jgi:hypothetical protein
MPSMSLAAPVAHASIGQQWACGHPITEANTAPVGNGGRVKCRTCHREYMRNWMRNRKAAHNG